jgi:hypothetical protein
VLKHLENCVACSELLEVRLRLKKRLKDTVNSELVPRGLRDRIQATIRNEGSIREGRAVWPRWSLVAAAVLLLGLSGVGTLQLWKHLKPSHEIALTGEDLTLSGQVAAILKIGISDHIHCVIESHSDEDLFTPEQVAQEMGPNYAGLVPLLQPELPEGFFISVGHRCGVNEREFVHLVLKHGNKVVSVVITERAGLNFPVDRPASSMQSAGIILHQDRLQSLEAVGFQTKDHLAFIVSSLEQQKNLQIATRLAPTVSRFLEQL